MKAADKRNGLLCLAALSHSQFEVASSYESDVAQPTGSVASSATWTKGTSPYMRLPGVATGPLPGQHSAAVLRPCRYVATRGVRTGVNVVVRTTQSR
jgi:hypothetical protein